jgi:chromosome partitioning protein
MARIPGKYREAVLDQNVEMAPLTVNRDPECLAELKHYRSLMPMAMEVHKPMFHLKPADGARPMLW